MKKNLIIALIIIGLLFIIFHGKKHHRKIINVKQKYRSDENKFVNSIDLIEQKTSQSSQSSQSSQLSQQIPQVKEISNNEVSRNDMIVQSYPTQEYYQPEYKSEYKAESQNFTENGLSGFDNQSANYAEFESQSNSNIKLDPMNQINMLSSIKETNYFTQKMLDDINTNQLTQSTNQIQLDQSSQQYQYQQNANMDCTFNKSEPVPSNSFVEHASLF